MSIILVKGESLNNYGVELEKKADEFKNITTKMQNIVDNLEAGWEGVDAENFQKNATAYLKNLSYIEGVLRYYGDAIRKKSSKYDNICENYYNTMKRQG